MKRKARQPNDRGPRLLVEELKRKGSMQRFRWFVLLQEVMNDVRSNAIISDALSNLDFAKLYEHNLGIKYVTSFNCE